MRTRGGGRYLVVPGFAGRLFRNGCFLPPELVRSRSVLKTTPTRRVDRVELACGLVVVVKTYPPRPGWERFLAAGARWFLRDREWRNGRRMAAAGLPCAEPLATGRRPREGGGGERVLVMRHVAGATDLAAHAVPSPCGVGMRRELAAVLGGLVRRLHEAGVRLDDPHQRNFLVRGAASQPEVIPVDLRDVRCLRRPLGPAARRRNLLLLYQTLGLLGTRSLRLRFLKAYLPGASRGEIREWARWLEVHGAARHRRYARRRASAALGTNRRFYRRRAGALRWHVLRGTEDAALREVLEDPAACFEHPDRVLKSGRSCTVVVRGSWVVKRYNQKRVSRRFVDRLRRSRARRTMVTAFSLEIAGIPTPPVVAAGEERRGGLVARGYAVTPYLGDAEMIDRRLATLAGSDRTALLQQAAELVARLHLVGFRHRDLKAGNVMVTRDGGLQLVDLDGVHAVREAPESGCAEDLERLFQDLRARAGLTREEERFLREAYRAAREGLPAPERMHA